MRILLFKWWRPTKPKLTPTRKNTRILLINPPHTVSGRLVPRENLPPLGLLAIGGPLFGDGYQVRLLDAEFGPLPVAQIVQLAQEWGPEAVFLRHSGSNLAHPIVTQIARELRAVMPGICIVHGGVISTC